jgi:hypothetical protein
MSTCTKTTYSWTHGREAIDSGAPAASQTAITLRNWLRFTPFELVGVHTAFFFFVSLSILFSFSSTNSPVLEHQETHPTVGRHPTPVSSSQEYLPLRSYNSCSSLPDPRSIQNGERNAGIQRARRRSLRKDHEPRQEASGTSTMVPRSPLCRLGSLTTLSSSVLLL